MNTYPPLRMTYHTPGPLEIEPIFGDDDLSIILGYPVAGGGSPIAIAHVVDEDEHGVCPKDRTEAVANANLFAAAPDMFAALEAAETMLMTLPETTTNANGARPTMTTKRSLEIVRAALDKAHKGAPSR